uniref:Sushi domain-containing protein n=1 Tax=Petromyzon marinus TaxID=7757 RepID=S4RS15_PETMA
VGVACVEGQWDKRVACLPVDCGVPSSHLVYHADFSYPHGTSYSARTTFVCRPPAILQGASAELQCQEDGLWSLPEAYCQLTCRAPPPMPNAVARTERCKHDGQKVGSSCKYRCKPGYHVLLTSRKPRPWVFKVKCTEEGHWEEGGCVPVQCPPLPLVLHGSYTCTHRFQFGSRCWVNCSTGNPMDQQGHKVIECRKNGRWSGELQLCPHVQGECTTPDPPFIIEFDCPTGYGIGNSVA